MKPLVKIRVFNDDKLAHKRICVETISEAFKLDKTLKRSYGQGSFFHYTSFAKLFDILEGDSFWASRSRFSNDKTEDRLFGPEWLKENNYYGDNYIVCFSSNGDALSQWRGYCPSGGVSIEFDIEREHIYTLPYSDKAPPGGSIGNQERYLNQPLPVIYCKPNKTDIDGADFSGDIADVTVEYIKEFIKRPDERDKWKNIELADMIPYIKNGYFYEESEARLVFDNSNSLLDKCVRFRKLNDGTMVPYIVVKYGDISRCGDFLGSTYTTDYIEKTVEEYMAPVKSPRTIVIPCGRDQAEVCREFLKVLDAKKNHWEDNPDAKIHLLCDGHLPITKITVSPSVNQEYQREVIERYCRSKYWLHNVEVTCSLIPYLAPTL